MEKIWLAVESVVNVSAKALDIATLYFPLSITSLAYFLAISYFLKYNAILALIAFAALVVI